MPYKSRQCTEWKRDMLSCDVNIMPRWPPGGVAPTDVGGGNHIYVTLRNSSYPEPLRPAAIACLSKFDL